VSELFPTPSHDARKGKEENAASSDESVGDEMPNIWAKQRVCTTLNENTFDTSDIELARAFPSFFHRECVSRNCYFIDWYPTYFAGLRFF
jgi:hypothetical protein